MRDVETRLSEYIDDLNHEKEPGGYAEDLPELTGLFKAVRRVKSLKEPTLPGPDYAGQLALKIVGPAKTRQKLWERLNRRGAIAAAVAGLVIMAAVVSWTGLLRGDVAVAMEQATAQLTSYHGIMQVKLQNQAGGEWMVRQVEIWTDGQRYALKSDGTLTVNNGESKWQVREQSQEVALLPVLPDPTRNNYDLRDEALTARQYPHKTVGTQIINGRPAAKLQVSPPGGLDYYLWVDKATDLPIQLQTAMQNGLQTTYTFTRFEPNVSIDPGQFVYQVPGGYHVAESNPGQLVESLEDAIAISGFSPILPATAPDRILAGTNTLVMDYGDTLLIEVVPRDDFGLQPGAALGTAAGGTLEITTSHFRWRQGGLEIRVEGARREELARQLAPDLVLPLPGQDLVGPAQHRVPVDMEVVTNSQIQVDRGSSPWQLDPLQVAHLFANLQVSPGGIQGEPQLPVSSFHVIANSGTQAVVEASQGSVSQIYLQRMVRQDETGIWTVVGYDI